MRNLVKGVEASFLRMSRQMTGKEIVAEREKRGWTQTDLAVKSGVSFASVQRVERDHPSVSKQLRARVALAFEASRSAPESSNGENLPTTPLIDAFSCAQGLISALRLPLTPQQLISLVSGANLPTTMDPSEKKGGLVTIEKAMGWDPKR